LRAYIVVDLGFGDSGKGLVTDFLVRQFRAGLVVRYNGGAQAGHNVVTPDGRHHTFSQFGSGTFVPHVKTYLARHVVIHPTALLVEGDLLERKGIENPFSNLRVSDQALVITPYHQAANRIREMARGMHRHGSCGVGVGEAVEDALLHAEARVLAGDLKNTQLLRRKLKSIRAQKCEQMIAFCKESSLTLQTQEFKIFEREDVIDRWITLISRINELDLIVPDKVLERWLNETDSVVFEGAQGVLLDAEAGFHPYTTWSDCTAANAFELIREAAPDSNVLQIGVMRSYAIRHGPGPLPTETNMLSSIVSEHNQYNQWQGTVRYGWFDAVLARYALDITKGVDSLVVTHMDAWSHLKTWNYCRGYKDNQDLYNNTAIDPIRYGDLLTSFRLPPSLSLEQRAQFTQALSTVTPTFEVCEADDETIIRKIESLLGQQVGMISRGPSSTNIQRFDSFPS
jgi:adenylosuccinate synthase